MFLCMYLLIGIYSIRNVRHKCFVLNQSIHINRKICKTNIYNFSNKKTARYKLMLGFAYLMPDYWLEVSLYPEGPATGQFDQGFPRS
jgi:hypothetical protein